MYVTHNKHGDATDRARPQCRFCDVNMDENIRARAQAHVPRCARATACTVRAKRDSSSRGAYGNQDTVEQEPPGGR